VGVSNITSGDPEGGWCGNCALLPAFLHYTSDGGDALAAATSATVTHQTTQGKTADSKWNTLQCKSGARAAAKPPLYF
jgi:hypothetical protein